MTFVLSLFVSLLLILCTIGSSSVSRNNKCTNHKDDITNIGVVINNNSRVGKEQNIAMEIAVRDIYRQNCSRINLYFRDSSESSVHGTAVAFDLIRSNNVEALVGTISLTEAMFLSEVEKNILSIPVLLLTPTAMPPSLVSPPSNLIQFSHSFSIHMQCLAGIIGHFQWRRVTVIYEKNNLFPLDSAAFSVLSNSLKTVDATIEQQIAFPPIFSLSDPDFTIEQELKKLKNQRNRVFILMNSSLQLATYLFQKAHQIGMVEKGFVWIVSDEIASMLDSVDPSVIASMQGVLGYKTDIVDTSRSYKEFQVKFRQRYVTKFPNDQGNPNPTLSGLRAYDSIHAISMAKSVMRMSNSKGLSPTLLSSNFEGLSGNLSFRNGQLVTFPTFRIINVVGKSYKELAFWTPELGLSTNSPTQIDRNEPKNHNQNDMLVKLGPIYWPGGQQEIPTGWNLVATNVKPLKIAVPASGVFQLVNVSKVAPNQTFINGFVIDVFKTSLKYLDLQYELVPFTGKYDDMVRHVKPGAFDAAVGDILILEERYKWADFSQPFVKSGMNMVVTVKEDTTKEMWVFATVFEKKTWVLIILMGLFTGFVVWLIEHQRNPEFAGATVSQQFGKVFWFSFTVYFSVQKESPRSNLSKIVLAPWYFLVLMLTIYFTASLTSLMTVSQLLPSVKDVETLKREDAVVACNWNSFVCSYLVDVLHFKPENVMKIQSIEQYHPAFERGEIQAAFFVSLHAKVFLAKYCRRYTIAGSTYNFGGFGFAFQKGSVLSANMSAAILKATEKGEIETLQKEMLAKYKCSSLSINDGTTNIGPEPFSGLFFICGGVGAVALIIIVVHSVEQQCKILSSAKEIVRSRVCTWVSILLPRRRETKPDLDCHA